MTEPSADKIIAFIKGKMAYLESYVRADRGGIGSVEGLMGFDSARSMLLAKSPIYKVYQEILDDAGIQY
jgi:hypothetical protein